MSRRARAGRAAVAAGSAVALGCLALTVDNLRRLRTPALPAGAPTGSRATEPVTVVLPVRDEEGDLRACATSVLAALDGWPGRGRLVVVDDRSTDRTLAVAAELAEQDPRVVVRAGAPTPRSWLGKPWACHQGAQAVDTEGVLVFVDADVRLAAHALVASVDLLRSSGLDLVSPYPRQQAHGAAERLVQPLLQWSWMSTLPLGLAERSSRPSLSAANGQLLVVDAMAYHDAGGHAAVRTAVLEDIALLRALKAVGRHGGVVDGSDLATCRMYAGWPALRAGYRKSLWSAFGTPAGALGVLALLLLAYVVPPLAALRGSRTGLLGYAAGVASRVLVARRTRGRALPDALAHPASVLVLTGLTLDSLVARRRGELRWRGRPVEVER